MALVRTSALMRAAAVVWATAAANGQGDQEPVSYTHLTLPTILRV